MLRALVAVVVGYLAFGVPAYALFRLSGHDPGGPAGPLFMAGSVLYGIVFAFLAGWMARVLAPASPRRLPWPVAVVAAIVALAAIASTVLGGRQGRAIWSPLATLLLMAPAVLLGGWRRGAS